MHIKYLIVAAQVEKLKRMVSFKCLYKIRDYYFTI